MKCEHLFLAGLTCPITFAGQLGTEESLCPDCKRLLLLEWRVLARRWTVTLIKELDLWVGDAVELMGDVAINSGSKILPVGARFQYVGPSTSPKTSQVFDAKREVLSVPTDRLKRVTPAKKS